MGLLLVLLLVLVLVVVVVLLLLLLLLLLVAVVLQRWAARRAMHRGGLPYRGCRVGRRSIARHRSSRLALLAPSCLPTALHLALLAPSSLPTAWRLQGKEPLWCHCNCLGPTSSNKLLTAGQQRKRLCQNSPGNPGI